MKKSLKNIAVTVCFCLFIGFLSLMTVYRFLNPVEKSETERRPLAQFPQNVSWQSVIDKTFMQKYELYSQDQFPFREFFRTLKANVQLNVLQLKENNGIAVEDGCFAKIEKEFNKATVDYSLNRLNFVFDTYLKDNGGDKYFCLIPDKNYFFKKDFSYPGPDYDALKNKVMQSFPEMTYIDIFDSLSLGDYYRTDTHWKQENLAPIVDKLAEEMGFSEKLTGEYKENRLDGFAGVYYGQSALRPKKDTLVYLTNDVIDNCTVYDYETEKTEKIYAPELFYGGDGYDVFLHGAKALLRIDNPNAECEKELVVFRDSFGSSLIPLLTGGYRSIYVVDIRYILPERLEDLMDFQDKDVLFLYSALILNQKAFR